MVDSKPYFCKHLHYSISAAVAQNCYCFGSENKTCKYSDGPCLVLEESKLNTLLASHEGPLIRGGPEREQWEKDHKRY